MKALAWILWLGVGCLLSAGCSNSTMTESGKGESPDAMLKETVKLIGDMTDILKTVKDKASAEAALPILKPIDERLAVLKKQEATLKLSGEELKQVALKHKATFELLMKAFGTEIERIEKLPAVIALLEKELMLFKQAAR